MESKTPRFLSLERVLQIHDSQIELFGGFHGIRDLGLLESALAMPQASFDQTYLHSNLFAMAAAYLFHIISNRPFLDGNKRTGLAAALCFLAMNGIETEINDESLETLVMSVANGQVTKEGIALFFCEYCI